MQTKDKPKHTLSIPCLPIKFEDSIKKHWDEKVLRI